MDIPRLARGRWPQIHSSLGIPRESMTKVGKPCPMCHGHDRFSYDDKDGRGTYICRGCGAGDGITLLMRYRGWDFKTTCEEVGLVIGASDPIPIQKPKRSTQSLAIKLWDEATDNDTKVSIHQYARRKGHKGACGARRGLVTGKLVGLGADCIIVPSRTMEGELVGVECINPDGVKQSFGTKSLLILGNDMDSNLPCVVVEGWATAVGYLNGRGWDGMAVISFGKGRLDKVAAQIEERYPEHSVLIARENDDA
jgi:phage/plasmid primase-like uncharacterized protein